MRAASPDRQPKVVRLRGYPVSTTAKCYRRLLSKVHGTNSRSANQIIADSSSTNQIIAFQHTKVHIRMASVCGLSYVANLQPSVQPTEDSNHPIIMIGRLIKIGATIDSNLR